MVLPVRIDVSRRVRGRWTTPELLPFSGRGRDTDPTLSLDGRTMFFLSDRPVTRGAKNSYDLWWVERDGAGRWGEPINLGAPINIRVPGREREVNEMFASMAADGTLYLALQRPGEGQGGPDLYRSRLVEGRYQAPENLGPVINSPTLEAEPVLAHDGSFLLFSSYERPGGYGDWDIYVTRRLPDGSWGEPENLGPAVNTAERDYSPHLAPDGHTLIFTSERHFASDRRQPVTYKELKSATAEALNGFGNIYTLDLRSLD